MPSDKKLNKELIVNKLDWNCFLKVIFAAYTREQGAAGNLNEAVCLFPLAGAQYRLKVISKWTRCRAIEAGWQITVLVRCWAGTWFWRGLLCVNTNLFTQLCSPAYADCFPLFFSFVFALTFTNIIQWNLQRATRCQIVIWTQLRESGRFFLCKDRCQSHVCTVNMT